MKKSKLFNLAFLLCLPVLALLFFFYDHPFDQELSTRVFSLAELSPAQKSNLFLATNYLDGTVLKPQEEFSFNKIVGPRTNSRGYMPAPSYLGKESPSTLGGGICLLSSALYQNALLLSFPVSERVAHLRTIKSVPPGQDASVWYGQADLKFKNPSLTYPILVSAKIESQNLRVSFKGSKKAKELFSKLDSKLETVIVRSSKNEILVETFICKKDSLDCRKFISKDLYRIN